MRKCEHSVLSGAARLYAKHVFGVMHQFLSTHQCARHGSAHVDEIFANWLEAEHFVERCRSVHLSRSDADKLAKMHHRFARDVTVLFLCQMQQWNECRLGSWIASNDFFGCCHVGIVQTTHRSTSPSTGSTDEITATASATRPPRIMCGRVWMLTKLGARTCMRYGVGEPSLAM